MQRTNIKKDILLLILLISVLAMSGCRAAGSGLERINTTGCHAPLITNVQSGKIIKEQYVASSSLNMSDRIIFRITAIDPALDVNKLYIRCFYPGDSEHPCLNLGPFDLPAQEKKQASLYPDEPVKINGPPGDWRIEVQVKDEENNLSNVYRRHVIINQW